MGLGTIMCPREFSREDYLRSAASRIKDRTVERTVGRTEVSGLGGLSGLWAVQSSSHEVCVCVCTRT